ncbi:MAG: GNAT family N-acetyltransferase [Planctomycetota bacterium]|jgi:GNAT superfamily N-acetyltransferase|nr:GNAT family N-acetyltransferase [Planctomycetota bacterium]
MPLASRDAPLPSDALAVRSMAAGTGFFRQDEVDVAVELVEERLAKGHESGYCFYFIDLDGVPAGYVCYGSTPCTIGSFDLYWIVVARENQGKGLGLELMRMAENAARNMGGRNMYVETSGKELYRPTRAFYEKAGYVQAALLPDFYDVGDDKIIYQKALRPMR